MTHVSATILIEHGMGGRKKILCSDLLDWDIVKNQKNFCKSPEKDVITPRSWKSTLVVILDIIYTTFNINLEKDILKENVDKKEEKVKEQEKGMEEGPEIIEEDVENVGDTLSILFYSAAIGFFVLKHKSLLHSTLSSNSLVLSYNFSQKKYFLYYIFFSLCKFQ